MTIKLFMAICVVALAGCGRNESAVPVSSPPIEANQPASEPMDAASAQQPLRADVIKIKGLFIGMDVQAVPDAFTDMLSQQQLSGFGFTDVIKYSNGERCVLLYDKQFLHAIEARMQERYDIGRASQKIEEQLQSSCYASDGVLTVKAGADGRVSRIEFNAVGDLFNAKKLQPSEFVRQVVNEYHIPSMKPNAEHSGWSYVSPDGTKLEIVVKNIFGVAVTRLYISKTGA